MDYMHIDNSKTTIALDYISLRCTKLYDKNMKYNHCYTQECKHMHIFFQWCFTNLEIFFCFVVRKFNRQPSPIK